MAEDVTLSETVRYGMSGAAAMTNERTEMEVTVVEMTEGLAG